MPDICVVGGNGCKESSQRLAEILRADWSAAGEKADYTDYKGVFNYGSSTTIISNRIINRPEAVKICVDKVKTLSALGNDCPTIEWTKDRDKALGWAWEDGAIVVRCVRQGKQGEGLHICENFKEFEAVVGPKFYSRYLWHEKEVRINLYKGKVLSVFEKVVEGDVWDFSPLKVVGIHPDVEKMCNAIVKNIQIDFCGIDVLVDKNNRCFLLEVNSGPVLHPETEGPLLNYLKKDLI